MVHLIYYCWFAEPLMRAVSLACCVQPLFRKQLSCMLLPQTMKLVGESLPPSVSHPQLVYTAPSLLVGAHIPFQLPLFLISMLDNCHWLHLWAHTTCS